MTVRKGVKEVMEMRDMAKNRDVEMVNVVWMTSLGLAWIGVFVMVRLTTKLA